MWKITSSTFPTSGPGYSCNSDTNRPPPGGHPLVGRWVSVCKRWWWGWWLCHLCSRYPPSDRCQSSGSWSIRVQGRGHGLFRWSTGSPHLARLQYLPGSQSPLWLQVAHPMPCSRSSSAGRHLMQLHLDGSCNDWFVEPSQRPVDLGTRGSGR